MSSVIVLPWDRTVRAVRTEIEDAMERKGVTRTQLSQLTDIPYSSLCRKLNNPSLMSLADLVVILSVLGKEIEVKS